MIDVPVSSYDDIASEYYDRLRHPTCANFREASARVLRVWLQLSIACCARACEVGAGDSVLAELLVRMGQGVQGLIISDSSPSMLGLSRKWAQRGANLLLNEAKMLPVAPNSLGLLVSSLGDPYNEPGFWGEAHRTLRPGGLLFFTTPAFEWANAFRLQSGQSDVMSAEFVLNSGNKLLVPSWIYPVEQQGELIRNHGLEIVEIVQVPRSALKSEYLSPKLFPRESDDINIVTGYRCTKPLRQ